MADERDKKPWQFSLKWAMLAMTLICVWLAVAVAIHRFDIKVGTFYTIVIFMGLGSTIGALVDGIRGAALGVALAGAVCFVAFCFVGFCFVVAIIF